MQLENRVFVVTGAGSGIGREIARRFADAGARIAAVDLNLLDSLCGDQIFLKIGVDDLLDGRFDLLFVYFCHCGAPG